MRKVEKSIGVDLDSMSIAVRNVVWSVSVQHGGAHLILERALHDLNVADINSQPAASSTLSALAGAQSGQLSTFMFEVSRSQFERDLILSIYKERRRYVRVDAGMDAGNVAAADGRYDREQRDALQKLRGRW